MHDRFDEDLYIERQLEKADRCRVGCCSAFGRIQHVPRLFLSIPVPVESRQDNRSLLGVGFVALEPVRGLSDIF